jgi:hypothetical protein
MVYPNAVFVGNSPNQDPRRAEVSQVIIHHTASTGDVGDILNMFMQDNSRSVSANFLVAQNGDVYEVVNPDTGRAWTTGSGPGGTISPDHSAITMEVMDETGAPGWTISEAAQESVAEIIAWAAARYGFEPIRGVNVRGHREMPGQSTACPGGMPLDSVTNRGIQILHGLTVPPTPSYVETEDSRFNLMAGGGDISGVSIIGDSGLTEPVQTVDHVQVLMRLRYNLGVDLKPLGLDEYGRPQFPTFNSVQQGWIGWYLSRVNPLVPDLPKPKTTK